jgi:hypothetical protein
MRLDPDTTQHTFDAGWLAGYEEGLREGFRSGYRAAVTDASELLDERMSRPLSRATVPPLRAGHRPDGHNMVEAARQSWGLARPTPPPPKRPPAAAAGAPRRLPPGPDRSAP